MSALIRIGQVLLLLLVVVGATLTHVFAYKNGTINMMKHIRDVGPQNLPLTSEPLRRFYTGIKFLDERLTVLACIFWPLLDGNYPSLSLHAVFFAGQVGGVWGLMMVEGMRSGNRGRMVS